MPARPQRQTRPDQPPRAEHRLDVAEGFSSDLTLSLSLSRSRSHSSSPTTSLQLQLCFGRGPLFCARASPYSYSILFVHPSFYNTIPYQPLHILVPSACTARHYLSALLYSILLNPILLLQEISSFRSDSVVVRPPSIGAESLLPTSFLSPLSYPTLLYYTPSEAHAPTPINAYYTLLNTPLTAIMASNSSSSVGFVVAPSSRQTPGVT